MMPIRSAFTVRNINPSFCVVTWRLTVSTSRLSQWAWREACALNSLMVRIPRRVSRKWLSRLAPHTIASTEALRSAVYEAARTSAYSTLPPTTSIASSGA